MVTAAAAATVVVRAAVGVVAVARRAGQHRAHRLVVKPHGIRVAAELQLLRGTVHKLVDGVAIKDGHNSPVEEQEVLQQLLLRLPLVRVGLRRSAHASLRLLHTPRLNNHVTTSAAAGYS